MELMKREKNRKIITAVFFLLLTVLGLLLGTGYGVPWDEKTEQRILAQNFHEYAYRLLGAENSYVQSALENGATIISQNVERDHGIAPYYPLVPIFFLDDDHLVMQVWHAYTWLLFMAGVVALYALLRALGSPRLVGCGASLLLYLSPRFFAEGHYNNKDVVLLSLTLCIFAFAAQLMKKRGFALALLFALAGALAANVKIIGIMIWGLACVAVLWSWLAERKMTRRDARLVVVTLFAFLALYFIVTPAMWPGPVAFFRYLISNMRHFSRWNGVVLFEGVSYWPAQGILPPWYYLPKMILLTVPVPYLLFSIAGQGYSIYLSVKNKANRPMLVALTALWVLPLMYEMLSRPVIYNGWRHFYFLYAGIVAMAGMGMLWLYRLIFQTRVLRAVSAFALAALFTVQAALIIINHPYQYVYFNVLAAQAENNYELDYWALSSYNALEELANSTARNPKLPLVFSNPETSPIAYFVTDNYHALPKDIRDAMTYTTEANDAAYLIYNTTYARIAGMNPPAGYKELFTIQGYGQAIVRVYEKIT